MQKGVIVALMAGAIAYAGYIVYQQVTKPPYALEVDATRDTTDISGIQYRIRVTNSGTQQLTGIKVILGERDVQEKSFLNPGETYFFYPDPETQVSIVQISTNEGIDVKSDYRSPTKVLGLPGGGR
jgi:hypothetical protein